MADILNAQIQFNTRSSSQWTSQNPTLALGEFGYESDTGKAKVGNGSAAWNDLPYRFSDGSPGAAGEPGEVGPAGASAYEIAVANGYAGTESDWLASLVGADGADGEPGEAGPQGEPGEDGLLSAAEVRAEVESMLVAGSSVTLTPSGSGDSRQITIAASGGGGSSSTLADLTDVSLSNPTNGQALKYQDGAWVNGAVSSGGGGGVKGRAYRTTIQQVTLGSNYVIPFNIADTAYGSLSQHFNVSTGRWVAPDNGRYRFRGDVVTTGWSAGQTFRLGLLIGGLVAYDPQDSVGGAGGMARSIDRVLDLQAGEAVGLFLRAESGTIVFPANPDAVSGAPTLRQVVGAPEGGMTYPDTWSATFGTSPVVGNLKLAAYTNRGLATASVTLPGWDLLGSVSEPGPSGSRIKFWVFARLHAAGDSNTVTLTGTDLTSGAVEMSSAKGGAMVIAEYAGGFANGYLASNVSVSNSSGQLANVTTTHVDTTQLLFSCRHWQSIHGASQGVDEQDGFTYRGRGGVWNGSTVNIYCGLYEAARPTISTNAVQNPGFPAVSFAIRSEAVVAPAPHRLSSFLTVEEV